MKEKLAIIMILLCSIDVKAQEFSTVQINPKSKQVKIQHVLFVSEALELFEEQLEEVIPSPKESIKLFSCPLDHMIITSGFGYRKDPFTKESKFHSGIDLKTMQDEVLAMVHGVVSKVGVDKHLGRYVKIKHGKYTVVYGHLKYIYLHEGALVYPGMIIGISGSTGRSTGREIAFKNIAF